MNERSVAETAEHLSGRRARMLPVLAVIFLAQQASLFRDMPATPTVQSTT